MSVMWVTVDCCSFFFFCKCQSVTKNVIKSHSVHFFCVALAHMLVSSNGIHASFVPNQLGFLDKYCSWFMEPWCYLVNQLVFPPVLSRTFVIKDVSSTESIVQCTVEVNNCSIIVDYTDFLWTFVLSVHSDSFSLDISIATFSTLSLPPVEYNNNLYLYRTFHTRNAANVIQNKGIISTECFT